MRKRTFSYEGRPCWQPPECTKRMLERDVIRNNFQIQHLLALARENCCKQETVKNHSIGKQRIFFYHWFLTCTFKNNKCVIPNTSEEAGTLLTSGHMVVYQSRSLTLQDWQFNEDTCKNEVIACQGEKGNCRTGHRRGTRPRVNTSEPFWRLYDMKGG